MGIDQAGQDRGMRKIDGIRACRNLGAGSVGNAFDPVAANHDDLIAARLVRLAIDENAGANDDDTWLTAGFGKAAEATRVAATSS